MARWRGPPAQTGLTRTARVLLGLCAALARMAGDEGPPAGEAAAAKGVTPPPTPAEAAARARAFFALLWRRYLAALSARPLRTKARA